MQWRKLGLIHYPTGTMSWAQCYALLPTAYLLPNQELIRVFFASLDEHQFGRVGYVDIASEDPCKVIRIANRPVLDLGELGAFDDCGVNPSCILNVENTLYMYYIGWQRAVRTPYMLYAGLATSTDGGETFMRQRRVPILDRTSEEPFSRAAPFVVYENGRFRMWYWSCTHWAAEGGNLHYNNEIRHIESTDGFTWNGDSHVCLKPQEKGDYSVGRPWVIHRQGMYHMWYSIRSTVRPYRVGYAESKDGIQWVCKDEETGIGTSPSGWDSDMVCYPCVITVGRRTYLFYNGNQHGKTGFGCAELESF